MQAKRIEVPPKITWQRMPSPNGDLCPGYQAKGIDGLRIERHHVDDREYDGGRIFTYWDLVVDSNPWDRYNDLGSAKREAERQRQEKYVVAVDAGGKGSIYVYQNQNRRA